MAAFVFTDANFVVDGVDLSDRVRSITLSFSADLQEDTAMGTDGTRTRLPGLKEWTITVTFKQDFAAGSVDETLFPLVGATPFNIALRPTSAAVSATNPEYQGTAILENYPPLAGAVGELAEVAATFQSASALVRAVV